MKVMLHPDKGFKCGVSWDSIRCLWRRNPRAPASLWSLGAVLCLACATASCTSAGGVARSKSGALFAWGPTSVFGEAIAKDVTVETREGDRIHVAAFSTHNPDRAVTGVVKDGIMWDAMKPLIRSGGDAVVKGTKDPNLIPKDPNVIPKDPNVIPVDPNLVQP